ncbi:hypothetical protein [Mucilaginibacter sp.]|uniref:hypothetical protein n=1 Tax=Mucilaginibacter sp. TaxID=1882438 RepID=UPI0026282C7F|nr:hypothetical protein [Mucilaginibacter sp.]MDB4921526.1 hypothetical protein [Mucilaginibacter sp.]
MELSDEEFREEYKPIQIPSAYFPGDTQENKIIFALSELGEGTVTEVISKLEELEPAIKDDQLVALAKHILTSLYDKGLLKGTDRAGIMHYNLSKITEANDGAVNPDNLAPGLD